MATSLPEDALVAVKDLVRHLLGLQDDSNPFKLAEHRILTTLKNSDSMYFLNTKDIQRDIDSMADKFMFHSFFRHAEKLKKAHESYISSTSGNKLLSKSELTAKLNIVKFLLCMSESPTGHFCDSPQDFEFVYEEDNAEEEVIDWGAYLNEGIKRWSPGQDEDSPDLLSDLSDNDCSSEDLLNPADGATKSVASSQTSQMTIPMQEKEDTYSFQESRSQLLEIIQQNWYNTTYDNCAPDDGNNDSRNSVCETPPSGHFQANVGILWDRYLQEQAKGLINVKPASVFSEYKVLREILWQMWGPHRSAIFDFCDRNRIVVKNEVTIASVRAIAFENFLSDQFLPHIRLLDELRGLNTDLNERHLSETYRSYVATHQQILGPVMQEIVKIEDDVRRQEHTTTLLSVAQKLDKILEPVKILKKIHDQVDSDLTITENYTDTTMECSLELVTRLRLGLQFSTNKTEQDIRLALYLSSLKYYLNSVDDWLGKNLLVDYTGEFIIKNNNSDTNPAEDWRMNFELHPVSASYLEKDQILTVISEDVLQIGRNLHLLRLLGKKKYELDENRPNFSTIYEEFLERFLKALCDYFDVEMDSVNGKSSEPDCDKIGAPAMADNEIGISGDLENFVDTSDGFLMEAFHGYHTRKIPSETRTVTLFERISKITTSLFPVRTLPEKILSQILKDRFSNSGLTVKRILVEDFSLDKLFEFLRHVFLFDEDLIFPFYRRLFEKMDKPNSSWGNSVWLTSHLHDVILDKYSRNSEFYENCIVLVRDYWRECTEPSEACSMISVQFCVKWPLNMIVTGEHLKKYKEVFQFLLKLKWALYTVNRLNFADLEPKKRNPALLPRSKKKNVARQNVAKQLKYLRFGLINILNTIQHYVFGYVLTRCRRTFELDFEKASDLRSLLSAHSDFIDLMHAGTMEVRDYERNQAGFVTLMGCVKLVDVMWNNLEHAWPERLETCCRIYRTCFDVLSSIVNPVCV